MRNLFENDLTSFVSLIARRLPFPSRARLDNLLLGGGVLDTKSVYEPLHRRLSRESGKSVRLTFSEIEDILGRKLPRSAHRFSAWWSNESSVKAGHTQAKAWMSAGFRAHASIKDRVVEFRRA